MNIADSTSQTHDNGAIQTRQTALDVLRQVTEKKQALDLALETDSRFNSLISRDKAFVRMLVTTCIRRLGQIDDLIRRASERDETPSPPALHAVLRLSATQIAFMNVPDYAAADSAVTLAENNNLTRQKGFVNAVTRQIARNHREWLSMQDGSRMNTPDWLMKEWIQDYGLRAAAEIAESNMIEASLDITVKNHDQAQYWAGALNAIILPTGTLRRNQGGFVGDLAGFQDGAWWIQDASAALPAKLFGTQDFNGDTVLDMCAAPGGKTMQLASMNANVIAVDRSVNRVKRLHENLERMSFSGQVKVEIADGSVWTPKEPLRYILLDAPCSATGTVRRHPDLFQLKSPQDIERLQSIQYRLLQSAFEMLETGGILLYCTCSLQKSEGEKQIETFLSEQPSAKRIPITVEEAFGQPSLISSDGDIRILPQDLTPYGGMDGFYIARLTKI